MSSVTGRPFLAFRGVPYAEPPQRFKDPEPVKPWSDRFLFDGTAEGPFCTQLNMMMQIVGQEDCLALNVYTHQTKTENLRPVMVWIHGGGFQFGSGNGETDFFGPNIFLERDIVLVTINYRVGPLGFFTTSTKEAPGNYGLMDQTMALKWVQEHIDRFGGDPESVTIFGESAGGASVDFHVLSPMSKGLFHRAISQSGTSFCPWAMPLAVTKHSYDLTKKLGCLDKEANGGLECLRNKKAEEFVPIPEDPHFFSMDFGPRIDVERDSPFLPSTPVDLLTSGQFNQVPVIYGTNKNEALGSIAWSGVLKEADRMRLLEENPVEFNVNLMNLKDHKQGHEIVQSSLDHYLNRSAPISQQLSRYEEMLSDFTFFKGISDTLGLVTKHSSSPTYAYFYTHHAQIGFDTIIGAPSSGDGVCHADELFLMFKTTLFPQSFSDEDLRVSKTFIDLWTSFAESGEPKSNVVAEWSPNTSEQPHYLDIKLVPTVMKQKMPFHDRISFWNQLPEKLSSKDEL